MAPYNGLAVEEISLAKLNHFRDAYAIFEYPGGICREGANDVHCHNIPKGLNTIGTLYFNKDHYTTHCKDYKNQEEWKKKRNPVRYESNLGKTYDGKNMCECVRLIQTALEIAQGKGVILNRRNIDRELLLDIKNHKYEYDEVIKIADEKIAELDAAVKTCTLKENVDPFFVNKLVVKIRKEIYGL